MTVGRYLAGVALLGLALVPVAVAAHRWRLRLLREWSGPLACLSEIVVVIAVTICVSELLGLIGLFNVVPLVLVLALVGLVGWYGARRRFGAAGDPDQVEPMPSEACRRMPTAGPIGALLATSMVVATWGGRTIDALHHGMATIDTRWYHMPFAARFVQQGTIVPLHYVDSEPVTVFYPASSELLHALGIAVVGSDFLSPMINLGWAGLALLAGWCIGRPYGVAPVTLAGVAALLETPGLVATQPGGAYDDVVGLALLLCSVALLVNSVGLGPSRLAGQGIAALAAGLALGTKFTFIAPVLALTVGIWVLARHGRRLVEGGSWLLLVVVTGGFWYVRNLVIVGNPLPTLHISLGPLHLPSPAVATPTSTVAQFLFDRNAWRHELLPGLRMSFGPAWTALLLVAIAGLVLASITGPGAMARMIAWTGWAAAAAFLVTPQFLAVLGVPVYFVNNARYADPAIVIGLVLLPWAPLLRVGRRPYWVLGAYLATMAATQFDGTLWPIDILSERFAVPIGRVDSLAGLFCGLVVLIGGLVVIALRRRPRAARPLAAVWIAAGTGLIAVTVGLHQLYTADRATSPELVTLADQIGNARIAVAGKYGQLQYDLYGKDLSNYVQYLGQPEPDHGYRAVATCSGWRRLLNQGRYGYVVTTTDLFPTPSGALQHPGSYSEWTASDPGVRLVRRQILHPAPRQYIVFSLYRIVGALHPSDCAPA